MKRLVIIGSVVLVLVLAGLVIGFTAKRDKNGKGTPLKTEVAKRGDFVIKINATGNLESLLTVQVKSNVEGEISKLYVKDGDFVEKGQILIQINDKQVREDMKQAEANVSAAQAEFEQASRSLLIKQKQLDSDLMQQGDTVIQAQASYNVAKATTLQQISQQETDIQGTKEALAQDNIALRQAQIALKQADLSLGDMEQAEKAAKVDMDNAESEQKRTQEMYDKKFVPKKTLESAQTTYANSKSRYDSAQKKILSQKETINSENENVTMREGAVKMRQTTLEFQQRNLDLLKQTRVAQEEQSSTQLKIAQTRQKQLGANISDEKEVSQLSIESAKANLLRNQSTLTNQKERLGWTTIVAPVSGIITDSAIKEGEIVTSGRSAFSQSPALMQIADLTQMIVKTSINEVDMEKLAVGQKVEIKTKAYQNKTYRGEVKDIAPSGLPRDNIIYFQVEITVLDSPKELRPGMTADVDIVVVERKDELLLPIEAVKSEQVSTALLTIKDVSQLKPGQSVDLESDRGAKFQGNVNKILTDNKDGNVEVALTSAKKGVRPGNAVFKLTANGKTISDIPAKISSGKENYVMLMPKGKEKAPTTNEAVKGIRTLIEVGEQNDKDIEILGGLNAGDQVIIPTVAPEPTGQQQRRG